MIEAFTSTDGQLLTLTDAQFGLAATVTRVEKGFAVTFIDTDSENIIATRTYDDKMRAIAYARGLISSPTGEDNER
jgi:hypothetical protein